MSNTIHSPISREENVEIANQEQDIEQNKRKQSQLP